LASKQGNKKVVLCPQEEAKVNTSEALFEAACPSDPAKHNVKCPDLDGNRLSALETYQKCLSIYASTSTDKMVPATVTDTKIVVLAAPVGIPQ